MPRKRVIQVWSRQEMLHWLIGYNARAENQLHNGERLALVPEGYQWRVIGTDTRATHGRGPTMTRALLQARKKVAQWNVQP
jgi:hypothetical protein